MFETHAKFVRQIIHSWLAIKNVIQGTDMIYRLILNVINRICLFKILQSSQHSIHIVSEKNSIQNSISMTFYFTGLNRYDNRINKYGVLWNSTSNKFWRHIQGQ